MASLSPLSALDPVDDNPENNPRNHHATYTLCCFDSPYLCPILRLRLQFRRWKYEFADIAAAYEAGQDDPRLNKRVGELSAALSSSNGLLIRHQSKNASILIPSTFKLWSITFPGMLMLSPQIIDEDWYFRLEHWGELGLFIRLW